jgi:queuine tRNA-ribosyltransferase
MAIPGTFELEHVDKHTGARAGVIHTVHGPVETPVFMPVGTQATVKTMSPAEIRAIGFQIILGNTYHLHLRPGDELIQRRGGLHKFMGWEKGILTDSGGYQVFSLSELNRIKENGVEFKSHIDGSKRFLGPVEAMRIQRRLGSDIAMVFDECPPFPCTSEYACQAVDRTLSWAALCAEQPRAEGQLVFGIVQGGVDPDLRKRCAEGLVDLNFDGFAIGGVSVGENESLIREGIDATVDHLPKDKPRYLMGVGLFDQMTYAVGKGIDMFDCVLPTRIARNGSVMTRRGRYPLKSAVYAEDDSSIDAECDSYASTTFTKAYIRHLIHAGEILGLRLITEHNLTVYKKFMDEMRDSILNDEFTSFRDEFTSHYSRVREDHQERMQNESGN